MARLLVAIQTLPIKKMEKKFLGHARTNVYTFCKETKTLFKSRNHNQNEDKLTFKWRECSFTEAPELNQQQHHNAVIVDFHQLPRSNLNKKYYTVLLHLLLQTRRKDVKIGCCTPSTKTYNC